MAMAQPKDTKDKLSKSILEMKFMKKSKLKAEKEKEVKDGEAMFSDVITKEMKHGESKYTTEPSFVPCQDLIVGRLSFQGINPEIERLMEADAAEHSPKTDLKNEVDVSDEQMAQYALTSAVGRKFTTKREHKAYQLGSCNDNSREQNLKKAKFLKPIS